MSQLNSKDMKFSTSCFIQLPLLKKCKIFSFSYKQSLQVRQWMQKKRGQRRGCKLLLLTGPTGSGKTATVQMLCRELKLDLIEWSCSEFYEIFYDTEGEEVVFEESQVKLSE